jgi:hypothetical protein
MSYVRRYQSAKERVSHEIGVQLMDQLKIHSDGQALHGGVMATIVGKRGTGKTTLQLQLEEMMCHLPADQDNRDEIFQVFKECVVHRGRPFEYFNTLFPSYWESHFPSVPCKKVYIHMFHRNNYKFVHDIPGRGTVPVDLSETEIIPYTDADELITKNLKKGAINVVFEPKSYMISPDIVKALVLRKLQFKLARKDEEEVEDEPINISITEPPNNDELPGYLRKEFKERKYKPQPAPPATWWFEFCDRALRLKYQHDFMTIFQDEAHQVYPATPQREIYHLCEYFSNSVLDMRRFNISIVASTHDITMLDYRVRRRSDFYIYMRGARPDAEHSIVSRHLNAVLNVGEAILEEPMIQFGIITFNKFQQQPPIINVDGMSNFA